MQDSNTTYRDIELFVSSLEQVLESVTGGYLGLSKEQGEYAFTVQRAKHVQVLRSVVEWALLLAEVVFVWPVLLILSGRFMQSRGGRSSADTIYLQCLECIHYSSSYQASCTGSLATCCTW